ncbi:uncharacterized protein ACBT44_012539 isoform 1-T1 [Syngnathus typhle]
MSKEQQNIRGAKVQCSDALRAEALHLIFPPSLPMPLSEVIRNPPEGLVNVQGQVESKQPSRIVSVRGARLVPVSIVFLKQNEAVVRVAVWREATLTPIKVGAFYTFSLLSAVTNDFGLSLNTTQYSKISGYNTTVSLVAIGLMMEEEEEVKLVDGEGVETTIALSVWTKTFVEPPKLPEDGLQLKLIYSEGEVVEICK